MYRGEHVDILYGNVKHAFFQVNIALYSHFVQKWVLIRRKNTYTEKNVYTVVEIARKMNLIRRQIILHKCGVRHIAWECEVEVGN